MFENSHHIATIRDIRSFRACRHATGPSMADGDRVRISRGKLAGHHRRRQRARQAGTTERKRAAALWQGEDMYRSLYSGMPEGIAVCEILYDERGEARDYRILDVNPAYEAIFGLARGDVVGSKASELYQTDCPPHLQIYAWVVDSGEPAIFETMLTPTQRTLRMSAFSISNERLATVVMDITEGRRLEQQLYQSQKIDGIGRLAGGIAHDFNNLLTAILGYSDLALDQLGKDDPRRADIEEIRKAGESAVSLTRQLLAFGRRQILQPVVLDLNAVVANMDKILRRVIGEDIEVVIRLEPGLRRVKADPGQIEQVIMNLAVNARDAMPHGGKLTIETRNVDLDGTYARSHVSVIPGPHVMLAVSDTGYGMDADTQARIFEPFFTTKERGRGTGLGLSTVYGIVKQSGGSIWVYSEPNRGSTFTIYLPHARESAETAVSSGAPVGRATGTETILLVEDDDEIRELAGKVLRRYGYAVLRAKHAGEAAAICARHQDPIHLLLTDVVLPGMNGWELAQRLTALRPGMTVLYTSGYTDDVIVHHGVLDAETAFLQKPFTPDALAGKVREVLDRE